MAFALRFAFRSAISYLIPRTWGVEVTRNVPVVFAPGGSPWLFYERRVRWLFLCFTLGGWASIQDLSNWRVSWRSARAYKGDPYHERRWLTDIAAMWRCDLADVPAFDQHMADVATRVFGDRANWPSAGERRPEAN